MAPASIRVLSYNIHHGVGLDDRLDLERIAADLESADADVIGLQEVDRHWDERSDWQDQIDWLAERLDLHHAYGPNLDHAPAEEGEQRSQYGTAILSRFPIRSSINRLLSGSDDPDRPSEQRGLLHAQIDVDGARLDFWTTHLDHESDEDRLAQTEEVVEHVGASRGPTVLVGDLNAEPFSTEVQLIVAAGFTDVWAGVADRFTHPAPDPTECIDYVFARGLADLSVIDLPPTTSSDHLRVGATVTLPAAQPK